MLLSVFYSSPLVDGAGAIRKAGGGGGGEVLSALGPTRKAGGGVSALGLMRKAGGGGAVLSALGPTRKGGGCPL